MQLTITGGKNNGMKFFIPEEAACRPTLNKVREAVFNILGQDLQNLSFIDSFAGSGIMGMEALSRGARKVYFFEKNPALVRILRKNLQSFSEANYEIYEGDLFRILNSELLSPGIIYVDPPHSLEIEFFILDFLSFRMRASSLIVLETPAQRFFDVPDCLQLLKSKKYGNTGLYFFSTRRENMKGVSD